LRACIVAGAFALVGPGAPGLATSQPAPATNQTPGPASPGEPAPTDGPASPGEKDRAAERAMREAERDLVEARIVLRTGRAIEGLLVAREGRNATIRVQGKDTVFDLADAVEFEELGKVLDSFASLRLATPVDDVPGRLQLVRWLRNRGAYFAALDEVITVIGVEPFNPDAQEIRRWLESQIRLKLAAATRNPADTGPDRDAAVLRRKIESFPVLTDEEINLIRVYEVDFDDPPRLTIPRETVEEFVETFGDHEVMPKDPEGRRALLRRDPLTVLDLMFRAQARPLYGAVEVLEDPRAMRLWRTQIHGRWFAGSTGSCASANCHGGQEAGRLYLNNRRTNTDATVYTNFFIADEFRLRDGTALINYEEPAESPLLQMALPRERSRRPHPQVGRTEGRRGWRSYFRDEDDLRFRRAVEWIRAMYQPHPDYPIEYQPPVSQSAKRLDPDTPRPRR
jgi:hypothetical protein